MFLYQCIIIVVELCFKKCDFVVTDFCSFTAKTSLGSRWDWMCVCVVALIFDMQECVWVRRNDLLLFCRMEWRVGRDGHAKYVLAKAMNYNDIRRVFFYLRCCC